MNANIGRIYVTVNGGMMKDGLYIYVMSTHVGYVASQKRLTLFLCKMLSLDSY